MISYLKLVHMELSRFGKIYMTLFAITLLSQMGIVWMKARETIGTIDGQIESRYMTYAEYAAQSGKIYFSSVMSNSMFYLAPAALSAAILVAYILMIWYRDWLFKNPFIYRLLMLPMQRSGLYFAKLTAIVLMVLGLVVFQFLLVPLEIAFFRFLLPDGLVADLSALQFIKGHFLLHILLPENLFDFVLLYGTGVIAVCVIFASVLLERSYRLKGLVGGVIYAALTVFIVCCPYLFWGGSIENRLYPMEIFLLELLLVVLMGGVSIALGLYLIKKKVTV